MAEGGEIIRKSVLLAFMLLACLVMAGVDAQRSSGLFTQATITIEDGTATISSQVDVVAVLNGTAEISNMMRWQTVTIELEVEDVRDENESLEWDAWVEPSTLVFEEDGTQFFHVYVTVPYSTNVTLAFVVTGGAINDGSGVSTGISSGNTKLTITNELSETEDGTQETNGGVGEDMGKRAWLPLVAGAAIIAVSAVLAWTMRKKKETML